MKLGFIIPNFPNERRVALLPEDIGTFSNDIVVENGFGQTMGIGDEEYEAKGCTVADRQTIYATCEAIFSLKLIQPSDYDYIRKGQIIVGWTHPYGSGKPFMTDQAIPKELVVVDLDNIKSKIFYKDQVVPIDWLEPNFVCGNSIMAGKASTHHALMSFGLMPTTSTKVAVLAAGNVSQGAFTAIAKLGADARMFYRKTLHEFKENIESFDVIINGIEVDKTCDHILTLADQKRMKKNCLVIDAAADAGNAIEGTHATKVSNPIYEKDNVFYYVVDNSPTVYYRNSSKIISKAFSKHVYHQDVQIYLDMIAQHSKRGD
ncbi:MAG: N(5)-(carboxyethyl)ornithine synthase [Firmicutes bacterium]|nr:N(5)-(carboxyethyl)ornithine synthase [Bacillota bacterium]